MMWLTLASSRSSFLLASIVSSIRLSNMLLTFSYKPRRSAKLCIKMLLISLRNATDALRSRSAFAILLVEKASHSSTVEELYEQYKFFLADQEEIKVYSICCIFMVGWSISSTSKCNIDKINLLGLNTDSVRCIIQSFGMIV